MVSTSLLIVVLAVTAVQSCDISSKVSPSDSLLPNNQRTFKAPNGLLKSILVGVGFQNYTCSAAGKYTSAGAVASLLDLSCMKEDSQLETIQKVYDIWNGTNAMIPPTNLAPLFKGKYFFQNSSTGIRPVWDYREAMNNLEAYVVADKAFDLQSPSGPENVDWLYLEGVSGSLASQIYQTDIEGGSPPGSCKPGSTSVLQVKYIAKYWFYGGNVTLPNITLPTDFTLPTISNPRDVISPTNDSLMERAKLPANGTSTKHGNTSKIRASTTTRTLTRTVKVTHMKTATSTVQSFTTSTFTSTTPITSLSVVILMETITTIPVLTGTRSITSTYITTATTLTVYNN